MSQKSVFTSSLGFGIALLLLVTGGLFAAYSFWLHPNSYPSFTTATFLDTVAVPFTEVSLGNLSIPIELDNFIVFQEFKAIAPAFTILESYLFGIAFFLVAVTALTSFSYFQKFPFLGTGLGWIVLLTLSNVNGLNIGGPSSNYPLLILISGSLIPVIYFHVWKTQARFFVRWLSILLPFLGSILALIKLSPVENPGLYLAEQAIVPALGFALAWIFWQGHAILSGIYVLLAKANQNLSTKISIQITILGVIYFLLLIGLLLDLKGEVNIPFPIFSPLFLVIPIGVLGWFSTNQKILQEPNLAASPSKIRLLYILGFAVLLWLLGKIQISANQPAKEMVKHLLVYSQMAFSLFFFIYLISNFLNVMNTGKAVHRILFKPYSLPYYHLRIGGIIGTLVITIYLEAIIAAQFNSLTTNTLGDYYYQTGKKLEASILYENSWDQYRYNPKAKFLTAQLLFELNQPTLAKEHLEQSFSEAPQVDNILLLCDRLNRENKPFEVIYYLERGLKFFPENPYLSNNLALFYTLTQKFDEAKSILESKASSDPVAGSNWIALQSKLGLEVNLSESESDFISQINQLAAIRKSGKTPESSLTESLKAQVNKATSPMLINAAWRNLITERNNEDPTQDLKNLDSLARMPEMLDYTMQLQESASLRSLGAGRVMEAVKNLNGLAFRNPGDAAYYLQLTAKIQAQNLDFEKAGKDLIVAEQKGFQAFNPSLLSILELGGFEEDANRIKDKFNIARIPISVSDSLILKDFNKLLPEKAFENWKSIASEPIKPELAFQLLAQKAHGLTRSQLQEIGAILKGKTDRDIELQEFLSNPDWANKESLLAFTKFLGVSEELTANPYFTPLVLSAADRVSDPLGQYETINAASDFNRDPLLWIRKVQAAKRIGLDNYAAAAIQEMSTWMTWDEIEKLQMENY
ncbi:hypothetical protein DFQ04_1136 [Algoriphagus boseongensis]|uniref:Tetratricopeptide repeat protein n=1 Tax=Algoriphagus boseongensis TaxID=1442587 RepID=A0A4R6TC87_9BACT|nr:hypothetical protein [Algoriphagus boseongensis]TDQ19315.1 hypothetical protein DFQ04_1136 [Algoriphagus boseongensis]